MAMVMNMPVAVEVSQAQIARPIRAADFGTPPMYALSSLFSNVNSEDLPRLFPPPGLEGAAKGDVDASTNMEQSPLSPVGSTLRAACRVAPALPALALARLDAAAAVPGMSPACEGRGSTPRPYQSESPISRATSQATAPDCVDDVDASPAAAALAPLIHDILKGDAEWMRATPAKGKSHGDVRWWSRPGLPLLCPVSEFPICLLPYPPFKLRTDPERAEAHRLVDGKFVAMLAIVSGRFEICGRTLVQSDVVALDEYIHRCKLGPYRLSRFLQLSREVAEAAMPSEHARAEWELAKFQDAAREELGKLRRIQESRLLQIKRLHQARCACEEPVATVRSGTAGTDSWVTRRRSIARGRLSTASTTASTRASSGSFDNWVP